MAEVAGKWDGAPGWQGRLGALFALLGFLFTATTPGLSLVAMSGGFAQVNGILGVYVCHSPGSPLSGLPGQDAPKVDNCCMVCQVAHMVAGGQVSSAPALWAPQGRRISVAVVSSHDPGLRAWHPVRARAPPVA